MSQRPDPARAIVFDLDGTLVDSRRDIAAATNHALASHGFPPLPELEIAGYVGDGARSLLARASRLGTKTPELDELLATFLDYYQNHPADFTKPTAGAERALEALRCPLGLCTNKPRRTTMALLRALGWEERFAATVAGGDLPVCKPAPEPLLEIARLVQTPPGRLIMVGDGPQDIECGRAVGCFTVGIPGALIPEERLLAAGPHAVLRSLVELPALVAHLD